MSSTLYAIGDIHGQSAMLEDALARIDRDGGGRVVFLGDYVDRGPDSRGVIETLVRGQAEGRDWVCLKGNHDRMMEWFLAPQPRHDPHLLIGYHWFHEALGGVETAASYGLDLPARVRMEDFADTFRAALPEDHLRFLQGLTLCHHEPGRFFVHAGIRPGVALGAQAENDLLWIREAFLNDRRDHGTQVVHGHTPVMMPELHPNRINLDTGAGYGRPLTVAVFEGPEAFVLGPKGREVFPEL